MPAVSALITGSPPEEEGEEETQTVPLLVSTLPLVPGAVSPVPPEAGGSGVPKASDPVTVTAPVARLNHIT